MLDDQAKHAERVLLQLRLAEGLPLSELHAGEQARLPRFIKDGLVELHQGRVVLTLRGRLLADGVTRDLLD